MERLLNMLLTKSWRTTALGFLAGLSMISTELSALLDDDPMTMFTLETLLAGLALIGFGWISRDNTVTSEETGAAAKAKMRAAKR